VEERERAKLAKPQTARPWGLTKKPQFILHKRGSALGGSALGVVDWLMVFCGGLSILAERKFCGGGCVLAFGRPGVALAIEQSPRSSFVRVSRAQEACHSLRDRLV
jgi:hypothetical protein